MSQVNRPFNGREVVTVMPPSTAARSSTGAVNSTSTGCPTPTTSSGPGRTIATRPSMLDRTFAEDATAEADGASNPVTTAAVSVSTSRPRRMLCTCPLSRWCAVPPLYVTTTFSHGRRARRATMDALGQRKLTPLLIQASSPPNITRAGPDRWQPATAASVTNTSTRHAAECRSVESCPSRHLWRYGATYGNATASAKSPPIGPRCLLLVR